MYVYKYIQYERGDQKNQKVGTRRVLIRVVGERGIQYTYIHMGNTIYEYIYIYTSIYKLLEYVRIINQSVTATDKSDNLMYRSTSFPTNLNRTERILSSKRGHQVPVYQTGIQTMRGVEYFYVCMNTMNNTCYEWYT